MFYIFLGSEQEKQDYRQGLYLEKLINKLFKNKDMLPAKLQRKRFDNEILRKKEELRLMKERTAHALKRIKQIEKLKLKYVDKIKKALADLKYGEVRSNLEEYLNLVEKRELPWAKQILSVIYNHIANFMSGNKIRNLDAILPGAQKLIDYHRSLQEILVKRIAAIEDEIRSITTSLNAGIPLAYLERMNKDEMMERALAIKIVELNSSFKRLIGRLKRGAVRKVAEIEAKVKSFEKRHGKIENIATAEKHVVEFFAEISTDLAGADLAIFAVEAGAAVVAGPESLIGAGIFHSVTSFVSNLTKVSEASDLLSKLGDINKKLEHIAGLPGFEKEYESVRKRYQAMLAA